MFGDVMEMFAGRRFGDALRIERCFGDAHWGCFWGCFGDAFKGMFQHQDVIGSFGDGLGMFWGCFWGCFEDVLGMLLGMFLKMFWGCILKHAGPKHTMQNKSSKYISGQTPLESIRRRPLNKSNPQNIWTKCIPNLNILSKTSLKTIRRPGKVNCCVVLHQSVRPSGIRQGITKRDPGTSSKHGVQNIPKTSSIIKT